MTVLQSETAGAGSKILSAEISHLKTHLLISSWFVFLQKDDVQLRVVYLPQFGIQSKIRSWVWLPQIISFHCHILIFMLSWIELELHFDKTTALLVLLQTGWCDYFKTFPFQFKVKSTKCCMHSRYNLCKTKQTEKVTSCFTGSQTLVPTYSNLFSTHSLVLSLVNERSKLYLPTLILSRLNAISSI